MDMLIDWSAAISDEINGVKVSYATTASARPS